MFSDLPNMFFWNCWKKTWSLPTMTCPGIFSVFSKLTNQVNCQYFKLVFYLFTELSRLWLTDQVLYRHNQSGSHQSPQILLPPKLTGHHQNCHQPGSTSLVTVRTAVSLVAYHQSLPELPLAWWYVRIFISLVVCHHRIAVSLVAHHQLVLSDAANARCS